MLPVLDRHNKRDQTAHVRQQRSHPTACGLIRASEHNPTATQIHLKPAKALQSRENVSSRCIYGVLDRQHPGILFICNPV